jgi:hypothetical protein
MELEAYIGRIRPPLAEMSKKLFGKQYRLEVIAVCAALDPPIWSRGLSRLLNLPENQVAAELNALVEIGALQPLPLSEFDRRKTYQAAEHPLWDFGPAEFERVIRRKFLDDAGELLQGYWRYVGQDPDPEAAMGERGRP